MAVQMVLRSVDQLAALTVVSKVERKAGNLVALMVEPMVDYLADQMAVMLVALTAD